MNHKKEYFCGKEEVRNPQKDKKWGSCFDDCEKKIFKVKIRDECYSEISDMIRKTNKKIDDICSSYAKIYANQIIRLIELDEKNKTLKFMVIRV